jgi:hypothetical protein
VFSDQENSDAIIKQTQRLTSINDLWHFNQSSVLVCGEQSAQSCHSIILGQSFSPTNDENDTTVADNYLWYGQTSIWASDQSLSEQMVE